MYRVIIVLLEDVKSAPAPAGPVRGQDRTASFTLLYCSEIKKKKNLILLSLQGVAPLPGGQHEGE